MIANRQVEKVKRRLWRSVDSIKGRSLTDDQKEDLQDTLQEISHLIDDMDYIKKFKKPTGWENEPIVDNTGW